MFEKNLENLEELKNLKNLDSKNIFNGLMRGVEKENLRITPDGQLAHTPHPASLGKALTHPVITTDFSESLTEIMTPPVMGRPCLFSSLENISAYAWHHLSTLNHQEYFWPLSMPVGVGHEDDIPIAYYGESHLGQFKTLYREGLAHRYGKKMQSIAGLHYNFSFPNIFFDSLFKDKNKSDIYFVLLRNFYKNYWILPYLFGASPACHQSLLENSERGSGVANNYLEKFLDNTWMSPYATSLRMSDIGYQNNSQSQICVSLNSSHEYSKSLASAVDQPYEPYKNIKKQLNNHLLQIENEYYSPIRPKQLTEPGERPTQALCRRGVRYIEVRVLDLNPFTPLGLTPSQSAFMDVFLTYCALGSQELIEKKDLLIYKNNFKQVVSYGRAPHCQLELKLKTKLKINLKDAAYELMAELLALAKIMDLGSSTQEFTESVLLELEKVDDPRKLPSQQVFNWMTERDLSHTEFGLSQARAHHDYFEEIILSPCLAKQMDAMTTQSIKDERAEVLNSHGSFENYLKNYVDAPRGCKG